MPIGEICTRDTVVVTRGDSVATAAALMRRHHVGCLVVVEERGGSRYPVGVFTDRDVAVGVVGLALDPARTTVGDTMGTELIAAREDAGIAETVALMRARGVRRMPVIDAAGRLAGIVSTDDVTELLAEELSGLADLVSRERRREQMQRAADTNIAATTQAH